MLANVARLCMAILVLGLSYPTFICIKRLLLHPLAKYPGPFLARITNLYSAYHSWRGDIHLDIWRCRAKYGNVVRYGPNKVLFFSAKAVTDIYGSGCNTQKSPAYSILSQQAPNLLTLQDKEKHKRRRRILNQAFSDANIRSLEPLLQEKIDLLCSMLGNHEDPSGTWSEPHDMADLCNRLSFDIMTGVTFDTSFDTLGSPEHRYVIKAMEASNVRLSVLIQEPKLGFRNFDRHLFPESVKGRKAFTSFLKQLLKARLSPSKAKARDIFSYVLDAKDPDTGIGLQMSELSTEVATLVVAGSDTTSTALAGTLFYINKSPAVKARVIEEVRTTFSSIDDIKLGVKLSSCTYLRACVDETLRLSPPGGGPMWREVQQGGAVIDGTWVPEGCHASIGIYAIHHSSELYDRPFHFHPDRWHKNEKGEGSFEVPRGAYIPFSYGPRTCIGSKLALSQIMLALAHIFWRFDINDPSRTGTEDIRTQEYVLIDHFTGVNTGPELQYRLKT